MPPPTLSFLADGLASYSREKIEAIRLVHTLLPTYPPLSRGSHIHPHLALTTFYLQSKYSSEASIFCVLGAQPLESPPGLDISIVSVESPFPIS